MTTETRKFYKAGEGRTVRRESDGEPWPEAGDFAENTIFTRRLVADGDLVEADPPRASKPAPPAGEK
jgi:hypothetical protein